ncbi:MAG TPA: serine hydrolase [Thermoanaerobaculia bacterium]|nr:serine hydrolase [Thermoanaerobaculia bacterium]
MLTALLLATTLAANLAKAANDHNFSGVILLADHGKIEMQKAWGFQDAAQKVPNNVDTKFNLGSINKIFTQVAIAQLAAAGKLQLDDTMRKHLPDYPSPVADEITIRELVDHRSGLGDFFGPEFRAAPPSKIRKLSDYLPLFVNKPLEFKPGTDQRYSNAGYIVLGLIIEKESGQSYYNYVRNHIFKPLRMTNTDSYAIDDKVANRAEPVSKNGPAGLPGRGSSAGGGYSTAGDLLRFANALQSGKLLDAKWTDWVFHGSEHRLAIAGGSPGVNGVLMIAPPHTLIVLANQDPPAAMQIAEASGLMPQGRRVGAAPPTPDEVLMHGPVDVPMTFETHVPAIEATINGKGPYRFEIDTGFGGMAEVSAELAKTLNLPVIGEALAGDPSGRAPKSRRILRAESLDIETLHFGGLQIIEGCGNILGLGLFRSLVVTFDYPHGRFKVRAGSLPADAMTYTAQRGVPSIEVDVAGQKFNVDIDSGSPGELTLPLSAARSLPLASAPQLVGKGMTADGPFDVYAAPLNGDAHIGPAVLNDPRIDFVGVFPVGNIGSRFLNKYAVSFDPANMRMAISK